MAMQGIDILNVSIALNPLTAVYCFLDKHGSSKFYNTDYKQKVTSCMMGVLDIPNILHSNVMCAHAITSKKPKSKWPLLE